MFFLSKRIMTLLFLLIGSSMQSSIAAQILKGEMNFQLGVFNAFQGKSQNIAINGLVGDHFSVTSHSDQNILLGMGYLIDGFDKNKVQLKYGINAFYFANTTVNGNVLQEMQFGNLSYSYDVTNYPLYLVLKSIFKNPTSKYNITLDFGIGPNIVKTSNVTENSRDGGITIPDHIFTGNTSTVLSAMAGIGAKFNRMECGYRFFYLGQGNFDKANGQVQSTLTTGSGYANAILCTIAM